MATGRATVSSSVYTLTLPIRAPGSGSADGQVSMQIGLLLTVDADNTEDIFFGFEPDITANASDATDGYPMAPGLANFLVPYQAFSQGNTIYFRAASGTQKLWWYLV